ncbi:unnamed protein product [Ostreobium quekettii]|uniref:histone acetyltransferase n=1 Tax=Ostreobium quekettii TaxID=121088 RepID=A0A8S1IMN1_9CHLO|nr:unnamed protein product [Ostreobium quekettii]|eukprot:evm.model.scf_249.11 EVM.evm.TU.scf_249.11   scf_249:78586-80824(-)
MRHQAQQTALPSTSTNHAWLTLSLDAGPSGTSTLPSVQNVDLDAVVGQLPLTVSTGSLSQVFRSPKASSAQHQGGGCESGKKGRGKESMYNRSLGALPGLAGAPSVLQSILHEKDRQVRHQIRWLIFLHHVEHCSQTDDTCEASEVCREGRKLLRHVGKCKDWHCIYPSCLRVRNLREHYHQACKDRCCCVCGPVREALKRKRSRAGTPDDCEPPSQIPRIADAEEAAAASGSKGGTRRP